MKTILLSFALLSVGFVSCNSEQNQAQTEETSQTTGTTQTPVSNELSGKMPKIVFADKGVHDFGTIEEGQVVEKEFKFKNDGQFPLIINNIQASCGCTTPEWPRQPIEPGQESAIKVQFNSTGKHGVQNKTVTVYANTEPAYTELAFKVMVTPKNESAKAAPAN